MLIAVVYSIVFKIARNVIDKIVGIVTPMINVKQSVDRHCLQIRNDDVSISTAYRDGSTSRN